MKTLLDAIAEAEAAALRNPLPPGASSSYLVGYLLSSLEIAADRMARSVAGSGIRHRDLAEVLTAIFATRQCLGGGDGILLGQIQAIAEEAKAAQGELREALAAAYGGRQGCRNWEEVAVEILDNADPGSHAEYAAAVAIVSQGCARNREALRKAFGRAGIEMCPECDEPIGIGCGAAHQCPVCDGHQRMPRGANPSYYDDCDDCPACEGSGLRRDYDRLLATDGNAHVA